MIYKEKKYLVTQMTKTYFSYIFGLSPQFSDSQFLMYSSQNPWNIISAKSGKGVLYYVNEVTSDPHLRMEVVGKRTNHVIKG